MAIAQPVDNLRTEDGSVPSLDVGAQRRDPGFPDFASLHPGYSAEAAIRQEAKRVLDLMIRPANKAPVVTRMAFLFALEIFLGGAQPI